MPISQELRDRVFAWVSDDPDHATAQEALDLVAKGEEAELSDRFDSQLEFGTAGLRGLVGAGPNRMNRAVVRRTTAGLCAYLSKKLPDARTRGLVIGRDGRRGSQEFAREAAEVAMGLGFVVHYFEELCPTPLCAFAVADLGAAAGVMVTASHNPPEYNGYKVYWANAAQIVPPHDAGIAQAIADIPGLKTLPMRDEASGRQLGLYRPVSREVEDRYFASIGALDFGLPQDRTLRIAYTPMHGVGGRFVERAMQEAGFTNFSMVALQARPDGAFPTVRFPNPEEPGAMDLVLELARQESADLVLANDPDADRLAVAYRRADGQYVMLTGNEIGVLLGHHRLMDDPRPPRKPLLITTIVSSPMLGAIAAETGARYEETLTGFKWIANKALEVEARGEATFTFGYEEALGSSVGPVVRDKDGVGSALVTARLAAQLKAQGRTIGDRLDEIASRFGVYVSGQINQTFPGTAGAARISDLMNGLRESPPWMIGDTRVRELRDYKRGESRTSDGAAAKIEFPSSNVLTFMLESGDRIIARPSGTEPKIKFYFDVRTMRQGHEPLESTRRRGEARMEELKKHFRGIVGL